MKEWKELIKEKPFYLSDEQCEWVWDKLHSMSVEEKAGQLFFMAGKAQETAEDLLEKYKKMPFGGLMFRPASAKQIKERCDFLQRRVTIPLLIAANLEKGGVGIAAEGTTYGCQMQVAATGDVQNARRLGEICGREGAALGVNLAFAPVVDIDMNWRNPITNTRTYGDTPERVIDFAGEYVKALKEHGVAATVKHFPGDGVDERDQHLLTSVNFLSCERWDETYGKVYSSMIECGVPVIMAGHIMQPAYCKRLNPQIEDKDIMPATMSPELITGLLRQKLGFNGVVITDAADMAGLGCAKKREDIPAAVINAGCDLFLFGRNAEEDYGYFLDAVKKGKVTEERLNESVVRVLALKASLGLDAAEKMTSEDYEKIVGCKEHQRLAVKCADEAITLVQDTQSLLPVKPSEHKRVLLYILGDEPCFRGGMRCREIVVEELSRAGFEVSCFDEAGLNERADFVSVREMRERFDIIMYFANIVNASNKVVSRISWLPTPVNDTPQYVQDIPTLFVSLGNPYHFIDVPMIKTIINTYTCSRHTIHSVIEKITGKSEWKGVSPIDPFCGLQTWQSGGKR